MRFSVIAQDSSEEKNRKRHADEEFGLAFCFQGELHLLKLFG